LTPFHGERAGALRLVKLLFVRVECNWLKTTNSRPIARAASVTASIDGFKGSEMLREPIDGHAF
jgi:hypothetical protein